MLSGGCGGTCPYTSKRLATGASSGREDFVYDTRSQPSFVSDSTLGNLPTCQNLFVNPESALVVLSLVFEHVQRRRDFESLPACVPEETERGNALPSSFGSHTVNMGPYVAYLVSAVCIWGRVCGVC